ncbi:hypothetical protein JM18_001350 [Phytophthora kernoviae]|uniref:Non-structural maintenance of chromosomes element 1 homolog n=2 Tax=Phytophthora kernoviae TaxID=325452 RepID=A0A8T0M9V6_9STRA|nr:hypothetical protein G195_005082 [Phytophthora kernoviae 00238/432]KAG2529630.1 hypothetical protein JM18_001350 [Phytophthora kernoviae]KAG2531129.1 hypothetical protein JM16_001214 [Phytophthora kernoviae]
MALNDSDRMLLQRIMAAGAMEEQQVRKLAKKLTGEEELTATDVDQMVNKVATSIRAFALDVRRGMYDDGKMYLAVVNTSNDSLTSFGSNFKPWEIVFLRKAIEEIVDTEEGALEESGLFNLRENTSISEVSELIRKLTTEKWLAPSAVQLQTHSLTLGPRAYLELITFLRDLQVKKCSICQYELLQGVKCREGNCEIAIHNGCIDKYEIRGVRYKCPTCQQPVRR